MKYKHEHELINREIGQRPRLFVIIRVPYVVYTSCLFDSLTKVVLIEKALSYSKKCFNRGHESSVSWLVYSYMFFRPQYQLREIYLCSDAKDSLFCVYFKVKYLYDVFFVENTDKIRYSNIWEYVFSYPKNIPVSTSLFGMNYVD